MTDRKTIAKDTAGMVTYDYPINHVGGCLPNKGCIIYNHMKYDQSGQFLAISARFLSSVDMEM